MYVCTCLQLLRLKAWRWSDPEETKEFFVSLHGFTTVSQLEKDLTFLFDKLRLELLSVVRTPHQKFADKGGRISEFTFLKLKGRVEILPRLGSVKVGQLVLTFKEKLDKPPKARN